MITFFYCPNTCFTSLLYRLCLVWDIVLEISNEIAKKTFKRKPTTMSRKYGIRQ